MWKQGDHLTVIGSTQSGKTGFTREILALRRYVVILVTKRDDYLWSGYQTVRRQQDISIHRGERWRLWPEAATMQRQFADALLMVHVEHGWTVNLDELYRLEDLKLQKPINTLLTQGASDRITVVSGVQRPAHVSRFALSEPRYAVSFQLGDGRDNDTVKEWRGREFARVIKELRQYYWACHDRVTGQITTGTRGEAARKIFGIEEPSLAAVGR